MCRNPLSQNPSTSKPVVARTASGQGLAELAVQGTMRGGEVDEQEGCLEDIQLGHPVP